MADGADRLRAGLSALGFKLDDLGPKLLDFAVLVLDANRTTNLVSADSIDELVAPHLLDSLAPFAGNSPPRNLIDIGSGAGFPGILLALAYPSASVRMLEPREKRFQFLRSVIDTMQLSNASVSKVVAETAGRGDLRETADLVTVRAVARPASAVELGAPLLALGGRLLLYIGKQAQPSSHEIEVAAVLGLDLEEANKVEVPYLQGARHAWWFRKRAQTPRVYPRRPKVPSKEPL